MYIHGHVFTPWKFGWLGLKWSQWGGYGWSLDWNLRNILGLVDTHMTSHDSERTFEPLQTGDFTMLKLPPGEFRAHSKGFWELRFDFSSRFPHK